MESSSTQVVHWLKSDLLSSTEASDNICHLEMAKQSPFGHIKEPIIFVINTHHLSSCFTYDCSDTFAAVETHSSMPARNASSF